MSRRSSPDPVIRRQAREATFATALERNTATQRELNVATKEEAAARQALRDRRELELLRAFWLARSEFMAARDLRRPDRDARPLSKAEREVQDFYADTTP